MRLSTRAAIFRPSTRQGPARRCFLETTPHVVGLARQLAFVVTARLGAQRDRLRDDVGRDAALDDADVGGGLRVDAAETHRRDAFGGDLDRADAALRRHAGVRLEAVHHELHVIRRGRARHQEAGRVAVEDEAGPGRQAAEVEVARAEEPDLLTDRERDLDGPVRHAAVAERVQHLADDRQAGLVVAAEDGPAVAADDVALDDRAHAFTGDDGVHVRRQQQGRGACDRAVDAREEVAGFAADLRAGVVEPRLRPERVQLASQAERDRAFLPGMAVDADEVEEEREQALAGDLDAAAGHVRRTLHGGAARRDGRRGFAALRRPGRGPPQLGGVDGAGGVVSCC